MGAFGVIAELLSLLLCIGAVVTNTLLLLSCDLWRVESLLFDEGSLGLFSWQVPGSGTAEQQEQQECTPIASSQDKDFYEGQILLCARWSAVAALALGGILTLLILFQQYLIPFPCTALLRDICAIGIQICLGLVYCTYFSKLCTDFECHYSQGTLWLIITQSLWAVGGILSLCMRPGRYQRVQAEKEQAKKQQQQRQQGNQQTGSENEEDNHQQQEAEEHHGEGRDTFDSGGGGNSLEAGLAKYSGEDENDGTMSETSSMAVGMSMNPEDDKPDGKLEQSTGLAKQEQEDDDDDDDDEESGAKKTS